jgi:hypothetical protein
VPALSGAVEGVESEQAKATAPAVQRKAAVKQ